MSIATLSHTCEDAQLHIFSYLDYADLYRCSLVSKEWKSLTKFDWTSIWEKAFPDGRPLNAHLLAVTSMEAVLQRIENFVKGVSLKRYGIFRCEFPLQPEYNILVSVRPDGRSFIKREPKKALCIFMNILPDRKQSCDLRNTRTVEMKPLLRVIERAPFVIRERVRITHPDRKELYSQLFTILLERMQRDRSIQSFRAL